MQNASAMKSLLFSRNEACCFTDLTHLSKGNFPFNLDNTLSMATHSDALQNSLTQS